MKDARSFVDNAQGKHVLLDCIKPILVLLMDVDAISLQIWNPAVLLASITTMVLYASLKLTTVSEGIDTSLETIQRC